MRNVVKIPAAFLAAFFTTSAASAADFGVYYLNELGMSQAAFIRTFGNKAHAKAAQDEINGNPGLASALRSQGIVIKNVILFKDAADGSRIYYVR